MSSGQLIVIATVERRPPGPRNRSTYPTVDEDCIPLTNLTVQGTTFSQFSERIVAFLSQQMDSDRTVFNVKNEG